MSTNAKFISLDSNKLSLTALLPQVQIALSEGVPSLHMRGTVSFADDIGTTAGGLRYNTAAAALEFSNDGNNTWNTLSSDSFVWVPGTPYSVGAVVLKDTGWYRCRVATTTAVPGTTSEWALLTSGTIYQYVRNSAQLKAALELPEQNIIIFIRGSITTDFTATTTASLVTIHSDESSDIRASMSIRLPEAGNLYWHTKGTRAYSGTVITAVVGTIWIDHLRSYTDTLQLGANVKYQRIDGPHVGGEFVVWSSPSTESLVPKDLSELDPLTFNKNLRVYADGNTGRGYISMQTLATEMAKSSIVRLHIDATGLLADRPLEAEKGYTYYAEDNGNLYVMGNLNVWGPGMHIKGEAGDEGPPGADGIDIGKGILVHKLQLQKPESTVGLFLQIRQSTTSKFTDSTMHLDSKTSGTARSSIKGLNNNTKLWTTMSGFGFDSEYNNAAVLVDLSTIKQERYLFYRWVTQTDGDTVEWKSTVFPSSSPLTANIGGAGQEFVVEHDHGNKPALDLFYIDVVGNLVMDGVVVVPADDRGGGLYLIYPEVFVDTLELLDAGAFTINEPVVQPGKFSAIKSLEQANSPIYNLDMNIINPYSYNTDPPVVDPGDLT